MIAALLLLQLARVQAPMPAPQDWQRLPTFPLDRSTTITKGADFIRSEVDAGRCRENGTARGGPRLSAPTAILVGSDGNVRQVVPLAIGCPTVEQFTAGYILSLIRGGGPVTAPVSPGWYRLTIGYHW